MVLTFNNRKEGQAVLASIIVLLVGSMLVVGAVVTNSTVNLTTNGITNKTINDLSDTTNSGSSYDSLNKRRDLIFILRTNKLIKKVIDKDCLKNKRDDQYDDSECFNEDLTNIVNLDIKNNKITIINSTIDDPDEMAVISDFIDKKNVKLSKTKVGSDDVEIDLDKLGEDDEIPTLRVNSNGEVYEIGKEIAYKDLKLYKTDIKTDDEFLSEIFTVDSYDVSEIIEKAKNIGYVVRIGSMYDLPPFKIYNGTSEKIFYDPEDKKMDKLFSKYINAFDEGFITISVSNSDYSFTARPWRGIRAPNKWKISVKVKNSDILIENIEEEIKVALLEFDLVDESFKLNYRILDRPKINKK